MRIALDTSTVVGTKLGGLGFYLQQVLSALQTIDTENEYLVFRPACHKPYFPVTAPNFRVVEIPSWLNQPVGNILWHLVGVPLALHWYSVDVYHLPDFRRALLWTPCRIVRSVHDLINLKRQRHLSVLRRWYHALTFRIMIKQADLFITVSENSKKDMKEAGFPAPAIHVIPNGVSDDFHVRPADEVKTALAPYQLPRPYVLCVARLEHPQKNHVTLLRAWAQVIKDAGIRHQLVLVGERFWNSEVIFAERDRLNLRDRVRYCDYVASADLPFFYNGADLFVFPSLYEGFGLPVIEAMASGVPVITSDSSSLTEIATGAALLFPPTDDRQLAKHIHDVLTTAGLRADLSKKGLERARTFNWKTSAAAHGAVFEQACARREGAS